MPLVELELLNIDGRVAVGLKVNIGNAPLLIIKGSKGYMMCGYLNVDVAEKLGDTAVVVTGVREFKDMLNSEVKYVTSKAKELGIREGMKGIVALKKIL